MEDRVIRTEQGLLLRSLAQSDSGVYHCHAVEHGFIQPLLRLTLQVIPSQRLGELIPGPPAGAGAGAGAQGHSPKHKLWYRDFLSLLDHPDLNSVEEFCDRVWRKERKQRKVKAPGAQGGALRADGMDGSSSAPKAKGPSSLPKAQKQQAGPPSEASQKLQRTQGAEGTPPSPNPQKPQLISGTVSSQPPKNNQKEPNSQAQPSSQTPQKSQGGGSQGGSQGARGAGGPRGGAQHNAKWKRMQENKKGRNRRTHEQQRPPRSV